MGWTSPGGAAHVYCRGYLRLYPPQVGSEISRDIKQFDGFTHSHSSRFRGVTRTVHILYVELKLPNGLKPSVATASLKFLRSSAKVLCFL